MQPSEQLAVAEQSTNLESCLTEAQSSAAFMLGRCMARKVICAELAIDRVTLWRWLQVAQFQDEVKRSNREWLSELNAQKARIIEKALAIEEQSLDDEARGAAYAHEIARNVLR